jgi:hypothetical protein
MRTDSGSGVVDVLLISVRTDDTRLINRALTLALSCWPPKPGSAADAVQPTSFTRQSGSVLELSCAPVSRRCGSDRGVRGNAATA